MTASTYRFKLAVPREVRKMDRESFYAWLWENFASGPLGHGLAGVHEGTLLSEEAAEQGLETDSWTLDSAQAPRERDWIESQEVEQAVLYFETEAQAHAARSALAAFAPDEGLVCGEVAEEKAQDWDANWKASFLSLPDGVAIEPFWRILPPFVEPSAELRREQVILKINPGAGFGTGTHETTQLCLGAIGELKDRLRGAHVLDFGSGSGILSIGAALLEARVSSVEIDPLANDNARENARLNGVEARLDIRETLDGVAGPFDLVIANILRPVLLEFAPALIARLSPHGSLILSGLIERDVAEVRDRYASLLGGLAPEIRAKGDWRALVWKRAPASRA